MSNLIVQKCVLEQFTFNFFIIYKTTFETDAQTIRDNAIEIEVYFGSLSYHTFEQSKKIDESSLISDIGKSKINYTYVYKNLVAIFLNPINEGILF